MHKSGYVSWGLFIISSHFGGFLICFAWLCAQRWQLSLPHSPSSLAPGPLRQREAEPGFLGRARGEARGSLLSSSEWLDWTHRANISDQGSCCFYGVLPASFWFFFFFFLVCLCMWFFFCCYWFWFFCCFLLWHCDWACLLGFFCCSPAGDCKCWWEKPEEPFTASWGWTATAQHAPYLCHCSGFVLHCSFSSSACHYSLLLWRFPALIDG